MGTQTEQKKRRKKRRKSSSAGALSSFKNGFAGSGGGWVTSKNGGQPGIVRLLTGDGDRVDGLINSLLCVTCFLSILVMGGRTAVGQLTYFALCVTTAFVFFTVSIYRAARVRPSWIDLPIGLGVALVAFQLVPLPADLIISISPEIRELLPALGTTGLDSDLPAWQTLTLSPENTRIQLGLLAAGWLLVIVARHRLNTAEKLSAFLDLMTGFLVFLALLGIAQVVVGNGLFFWFYEHPYASADGVAKGSFTNPNQFGGCLALGIAWPLWRILSPVAEQKDEFGRKSSLPTVASSVAVGIILPTILLTQSRVAMVCAVVAVTGTIVLSAFAPRKQKSSKDDVKKSTRPVLLLAGFAAIGAIVLTMFGDGLEADIERNVIELSSGDLEKLDNNASRRTVWGTAIRGSADFPWFGAGLGAHGSLYPHYWDGPVSDKWYSHVENGFLQTLLETGRVGFAAIAALVVLVFYRLTKALRKRTKDQYWFPALGVALILLTVNLAESTTDFIWHAPGAMALLVVVLGGAIGVTAKPLDQYGPRIFPILGTGAALLLAVTFGPKALRAAQAEPHWHAYASMSKTTDSDDRARLMQLQQLLAAYQADPSDPRINAGLAKLYLWAFDLGQDKLERFKLADLRDVVRGGGWETPEQVQEWLRDEAVASRTIDALVASRQHALKALRESPLHVRATLAVAKTNFLFDINEDADDSLYAQAIAINPKGSVGQFEAGVEAFRKGDLDAAQAAWKVAYENDARIRRSIATLIATNSSASELIEMLHPDAEGFAAIEGVYESLAMLDDERVIAMATGKAWEDRAADETHSLRRIYFLQKSSRGYERGEDLDAAERVARLAFEIGPADMIARRTLGEVLRTRQKWEEAAEHLMWCSQLKGNDRELRERANECLELARKAPDPSVYQLAAPEMPTYR